MRKKDDIYISLFRRLGNLLIFLSIFGFFATFGPAAYYEASFRLNTLLGKSYAVAELHNESGETELGKLLTKYENNGSSLTSDEQSKLAEVLKNAEGQKILVPKSVYFSIIIPKIGANAKVVENVDPTDEKIYLNALQEGVAHAKGTVFPGMDGNIYLFAHSADNWWNIGRYNAVFYLLKELTPGDEVVVFFQGARHNYVVYENKVAESTEVEYLDANSGGGERLILQTCWPPGTAWKRQLVFARPK